MQWYIKVIKNYFGFSGRARRSEYWYFVLFNLIFSIIASILDRVLGLGGEMGGGPIGGLYSVAVLIPSLAVLVRRLHDTGRSAWNILWVFLPIIGWIVLLVFLVQDSQPGANQYGPNPKELAPTMG